jgi:tetratricopeptide (TPR) repeat protein
MAGVLRSWRTSLIADWETSAASRIDAGLLDRDHLGEHLPALLDAVEQCLLVPTSAAAFSDEPAMTMMVERVRAETLIQVGRLDDAQNIADEYLLEHPGDDGGSFTSVKALILAKSGKQKEAKEAINRAAKMGKGFGHFHHTAYNIASAYAVLNKPDEAVKWLEAAIDDGFPNYTYIAVDSNLDNLREYPKFITLLSDLRQQLEHFKQLAS